MILGMSDPLFGSASRVLVSDFDGTMTQHDFYQRAQAAYPPRGDADPWNDYLAGRLSHFDALQQLFASLPGDENQVMELARSAQLDAGLGDSLPRLRQAGWSVVVVSAGCAWYIERLLGERGVKVPLVANPGRLLPAGGLWMERNTDSPFYAPDTGVDKSAVVRAALEGRRIVAFAGDGPPDLTPALLVAAELRFARGWLAEALADRGEGFRPYATWSNIADTLIREVPA
jgi:2-hydroxy-3-keto-5-methylthiopentenyl-1-phosphate phosphatase